MGESLRTHTHTTKKKGTKEKKLRKEKPTHCCPDASSMCHHAARLLTTVQVKHVWWARIRMQLLGRMGQWQQGVTIACVHPWLRKPNSRGAEEAGANGADAALCNMGQVF